MPDTRPDLVRWFMTIAYLATPLFALLDFGFDRNLRVAFLEAHGGWRIAYYATVMGLGLVMLWVPIAARPLGIVEAGINVGLTCLTIFLPYVDLIRAAETGRELAMPEFPLGALAVNFSIIAVGTLGGRFSGPAH